MTDFGDGDADIFYTQMFDVEKGGGKNAREIVKETK
jgi:hypothetical protein